MNEIKMIFIGMLPNSIALGVCSDCVRIPFLAFAIQNVPSQYFTMFPFHLQKISVGSHQNCPNTPL